MDTKTAKELDAMLKVLHRDCPKRAWAAFEELKKQTAWMNSRDRLAAALRKVSTESDYEITGYVNRLYWEAVV